MPLVGWLLMRCPAPWLRRGHRVALVWVAGLGYLGLLALLTWQALRGQSVVAPDAATLTALGALIGCAALAAAVVVAHASRARKTTSLSDQPVREQAQRAPAASA